MYLVTIQSKKQGEFEPKQVLCTADNLYECIHYHVGKCSDVVAIITYVAEY